MLNKKIAIITLAKMNLTQKEHSHLPKMVTYHGKQEMI